MAGDVSTRVRALAQLHGEVTEKLILDSALAALERMGEVTARGAAAQAGISERTVFRYFPSREALLEAVAAHFSSRIASPAPPRTLDELRAMPRALFGAFESHRDLVRAAWHSELRSYMIAGAAKGRWVAIERVVDAAVPQAQARRRKLAAASIRYHLSASTWHYYRFVFRFTIDEAIEAVEEVIDAQLASLGKPRATRNPPTRRVGRR